MMHDHGVDLVLADEEVLVSDRIALRRVTVKGVRARRPQISPEDVQVRYLLRVARIQPEKVLSSLGDAFDLRADGYEAGGFVLGTTDHDAGYFILKRLRRLVRLHEFALFVLPVLEAAIVANDDYRSKGKRGLDSSHGLSSTYTFGVFVSVQVVGWPDSGD